MPAQSTSAFQPMPHHPMMDAHFVAPDILRRSDVFSRRAKLLRIVSADIIPGLTQLHGAETVPDRGNDIRQLSQLVLGTDLETAIDFIINLRDRGASMDSLFVDVLEPAARYLGSLWDEDTCDFIDVTLAVGRLQHLLAIFNETHTLPAMNEKRQVLLTTMPNEQHFFGAAMVEKFLIAGGWTVQAELAAATDAVAELVERRWFAVVGLTLSCDTGVAGLTEMIGMIRERSCNRRIGIMVGGPVFTAEPKLAAALGADATAVNAPAAVVLAQKLFDRGARTGWK